MTTHRGQSCTPHKYISNGPGQLQANLSGVKNRVARKDGIIPTVALASSSSNSMHRWQDRISTITTANAAAAGTARTVTADSTHSRAAVSDKISPSESFDVVVIGAGIGGLSCAAMLAYYGFKVRSCHMQPRTTAARSTSKIASAQHA